MKKIGLTRGYSAIVDDRDHRFLKTFSWAAHGKKPWIYARNGRLGSMSNFLFGYPRAVVDHIDGNTLNNQRHNLRACTTAENVRNRRKLSKATSKYKGVFARKRAIGWSFHAYITRRDRPGNTYLGSFTTAEEAARAYDRAAKKLFGKFACLNFGSQVSK